MSNDSNFDSLFTPFSIGKMEIKNRLVMSPMGTYAALMDGSVSDTLATYFEERAKGGVGAIITASQYLTPKLAQGIYGTYFDSKRIIPHLTGMTERIHCYGAKAIAQLKRHRPQRAPQSVRRRSVLRVRSSRGVQSQDSLPSTHHRRDQGDHEVLAVGC